RRGEDALTMLGFRVSAALALLLAIPAVASASPVVLTTRHVIMFVDGSKEQTANGAGYDQYGVLSAVNDGTVLVQFADGGMTDVEAISPAMNSRTVKRFPRVA